MNHHRYCPQPACKHVRYVNKTAQQYPEPSALDGEPHPSLVLFHCVAFLPLTSVPEKGTRVPHIHSVCQFKQVFLSLITTVRVLLPAKRSLH